MADIIGWMPRQTSVSLVAPAAGKTCTFVADHPTLELQGLNAETKSFCDDKHGLLGVIDGFPQWNDTELAAIARRQGGATALIEAYRRHHSNLLTKLRGHFAIAVLDRQARRVLLAVDRMGTRPLCYAETAEGIAFASSAARLHELLGVDKGLNLQSLYNYVYFHVIPSPDTAYKDIAKLEPAQCLYYEDGRITVERYWAPRFASERGENDVASLKSELLATLENAVRQRLQGPIGAFLSGGLDSSTVSGMLARVSPVQVPTFSIGFAEEGYDEIDYARIAANHFGTRQNEHYVSTDDVANAIPEIAAAYDEPFGNSSAIPTLLCARLAQSYGVSTLLAGDGGDELFAGNQRYAKQKLFEAYFRIPGAVRRAVLEPLFLASWFGAVPPGMKIRRYIQQAKIPMPTRMQSYNLLNSIAPNEVFTRDFLRSVDPTAPETHLREVYARAPSPNLLHRMLYLDWKLTLADNDLRKVNRMCDLAGVSVRYPMLDDALVDLSTRVPPSLNLRGGALRHFYKDALHDFLPNEILRKRKHGFGLPFGQWLYQSPQLQQLVDSSLASLGRRGLIKAEFLARLLNSHRSEHAAYYGSTVWVLTMLEQWFQAHRASP